MAANDLPRTTTGSAARNARDHVEDAGPERDDIRHAEDRLSLANTQGIVGAWKERLRRARRRDAEAGR